MKASNWYNSKRSLRSSRKRQEVFSPIFSSGWSMADGHHVEFKVQIVAEDAKKDLMSIIMTPAEARTMASALLHHADNAEKVHHE